MKRGSQGRIHSNFSRAALGEPHGGMSENTGCNRGDELAALGLR